MKQYKQFILAILLIVPTFNIYAACSGAECCPVSSGVVTLGDDTGCAIEPDSYSIKMFKMYLCTSAPSAPTASAATGYSDAGCVQVLESVSGSEVTMTPGGDSQEFTGATFTRPPNGAYTHGVMLIDNIFTISMDREFSATLTGGSSGTGKYCATIAGSANEATGGSVVCSGSDNLTAGNWGAILTSFDGSSSEDYDVTATNLNGTGNDISGYLVTSAEKLSTSRGAVTDLIGIQTFASPVVITKEFRGLNIAFGINQGSTLFDSEGGSDITIEAGSGPFMAIITPLNY